jgi:hypothetical protein
MTSLYLAAAVLALVAGLRAARRLRRERSALVAAFAVSMAASGTALMLAALTPGLLLAVPSHPVITWASEVLGLVAAWAFLGMLTAVAGEAARPAVPRLLAVPAAGAILAALVQAALEHATDFVRGAAPPATGLPAAAAGLVLLAFCCPALAGIGVVAWRCSRRMPVRYAGLGMRAVAMAAAAELVLTLAREAEVTAAVYGAPAWGSAGTAVNAAQGVAVIQVIAGATAPAWFPAAVSASRHGRMWAAWCRLRPLWALLLEAAPGVRLPAQPGTRLSARYRLHRRVIEIRDAELALRPFRDNRAAREAADAAQSAGLARDERDAVIEAVMIVTALGARRNGTRLPGAAPAGRAVPEPRNDLESEADRLLLVSRAVRRSPIVHQAAIQATRNRSCDSLRG